MIVIIFKTLGQYNLDPRHNCTTQSAIQPGSNLQSRTDKTVCRDYENTIIVGQTHGRVYS